MTEETIDKATLRKWLQEYDKQFGSYQNNRYEGFAAYLFIIEKLTGVKPEGNQYSLVENIWSKEIYSQ